MLKTGNTSFNIIAISETRILKNTNILKNINILNFNYNLLQLNQQLEEFHYTILLLIGMVFKITWDVLWDNNFKFSASAAASEFCEWVQVGIDVYIPHRKYQVKPHSSPWFSAACAAAIVHRNHFFVCTNSIYYLNITG